MENERSRTFVRVLVERVNVRRLDDARAALAHTGRLAEVACSVASTSEVRAGTRTELVGGGVLNLAHLDWSIWCSWACYTGRNTHKVRRHGVGVSRG